MADITVTCMPSNEKPPFADRVVIGNVSIYTEPHETLGQVVGIEGFVNGTRYQWAMPVDSMSCHSMVILAANAAARTLKQERVNG